MQSFDSSQGRVKACVMSQLSIKPIHYTLNELRLKAAKVETGNLWVPVARSGFRPPGRFVARTVRDVVFEHYLL